MTARFLITDGTTTVRLINGPYHVANWRPQTPDYKGGGYWFDAPLADGRQLFGTHFDLAIETIELVLRGNNQNEAISFSQKLRRLLEKAAAYWIDPFAVEPVWLEARASNETETRYALVHRGRLVDDGNPLAQPFLQADCAAVMTDLTLVIERGHWLSNRPGTADCVELNLPIEEASADYLDTILATAPFAVWPLNETAGTTAEDGGPNGLNGTYSGVTLDATTFLNGEGVVQIDDATGYVNIYSGTLSNEYFNGDQGTALLWFKPPSAGWWTDGNEHYLLSLWGGGDDHIIVSKNANSTISYTYTASSNPSGQGRKTISATGLTSTNWISVLITWQVVTLGDDSFIVVGLLVNGTVIGAEVIYNSQWSGILFAARTVIGAQTTAPLLNAGDAYMAYVALWNRGLSFEEILAVIEPPQISPAASSQPPTCLPEAFAANHYRFARLAYVWRFDSSAATYTDLNLLTVPFALFAAPVQANDILYFGADRPFDNIIFDLIGGQGYSGDWEFWDGAWTAITPATTPSWLRDSTADLINAGVGSVTWATLTGWTTTSVNGTTAYWVRFNVTSVSSPTSAQQDNRLIYSQRLPYIEVGEATIGGDIPALLRMTVRNEWHTDDISGTVGVGARTGDLFIASRSVWRGGQFSPYLNASDVHEHFGLTVAVGTDTVFAADIGAPTGRVARYSGGAGSSYTTILTFTLDDAAARQYLGRFVPILRVTVTNASGSHTQVRLAIRAGREIYSNVFNNGPTVFFGSVYAAWPFDPVTLGSSPIPAADETYQEFVIEVQVAEQGTATHTIDIIDLILLPIDEWYGKMDNAASDAVLAENDLSPVRNQLLVDSITNPKRQIRAVVTRQDDSRVLVDSWIAKTPGAITILPRTKVRYFFFSANGSAAQSHALLQIGLERNQRYLSARGND